MISFLQSENNNCYTHNSAEPHFVLSTYINKNVELAITAHKRIDCKRKE